MNDPVTHPHFEVGDLTFADGPDFEPDAEHGFGASPAPHPKKIEQPPQRDGFAHLFPKANR
jgi:hypothetical protein